MGRRWLKQSAEPVTISNSGAGWVAVTTLDPPGLRHIEVLMNWFLWFSLASATYIAVGDWGSLKEAMKYFNRHVDADDGY
jgi:hypothetical protein